MYLQVVTPPISSCTWPSHIHATERTAPLLQKCCRWCLLLSSSVSLDQKVKSSGRSAELPSFPRRTTKLATCLGLPQAPKYCKEIAWFGHWGSNFKKKTASMDKASRSKEAWLRCETLFNRRQHTPAVALFSKLPGHCWQPCVSGFSTSLRELVVNMLMSLGKRLVPNAQSR